MDRVPILPRLLSTLAAADERHRTAVRLATLPERALADMGLTREEVRGNRFMQSGLRDPWR